MKLALKQTHKLLGRTPAAQLKRTANIIIIIMNHFSWLQLAGEFVRAKLKRPNIVFHSATHSLAFHPSRKLHNLEKANGLFGSF